MDAALTPAFEIPARVRELAARVKLVLFDVDGVLTDARLIIGDDGQEYKAFNSKDGHGIKMMQSHGIAAGIITGRNSKVVEHRVRDLNIKHVYQGCRDKHPVYRRLLDELKLKPVEEAHAGGLPEIPSPRTHRAFGTARRSGVIPERWRRPRF